MMASFRPPVIWVSIFLFETEVLLKTFPINPGYLHLATHLAIYFTLRFNRVPEQNSEARED